MRVEVNAHGRQVAIDVPDVNATYDQVADKALAVWRATGEAQDRPGPAFGLQAERSPGPARTRWMGEGAPVPVTVQADQ